MASVAECLAELAGLEEWCERYVSHDVAAPTSCGSRIPATHQHRAKPLSCSTGGGSSRVQTSITSGQRGWKRHALDGERRSGGAPGMPSMRVPRILGSGTRSEPIRARV